MMMMKETATTIPPTSIQIHQINVKPTLSNSFERYQPDDMVKADHSDCEINVNAATDTGRISPSPVESPINRSSSIRICCVISCIVLILFVIVVWLWLNEELNLEFSSIQQFGWNIKEKKLT